jgi:hypothetical protein
LPSLPVSSEAHRSGCELAVVIAHRTMLRTFALRNRGTSSATPQVKHRQTQATALPPAHEENERHV